MKADQTVHRRGIVPAPQHDGGSNFVAQFETSYRAAYVPESSGPQRGETFNRAPKPLSQMTELLAQSKTTMADFSPTQRASYRSPALEVASTKIEKIQQPKQHSFCATSLARTQPKCQ